MNVASNVPAGPGKNTTSAAPRPWGRYGLRTTAAVYLGFLVALPIFAIAKEGLSLGPSALVSALVHPIALSALGLSLELALAMALINAVMGTLIAYVLVRYRFAGRTLLNLVIDLPFAVPTLVAGLMLVELLGPRTPIGSLAQMAGIRLVYAKPAMLMALLFVTLPFVIRSVEPVLMELDPAEEQAAYTLGASPLYTFRRVVLPALFPSVLSGALLSFSRALGEFGSIVVVAGNIPRRTLSASVFVYGEVESGNPIAASAMSLVLIFISFATLLGVDLYERKRSAYAA